MPAVSFLGSGALSICPALAVALLLGMLIGIERQVRQRHTGLNTHALVSLGAAAFTSLVILIEQQTDIRMGGQVVTGIGFLGAGLIMRDGPNVRGLAGAATIWATGAVGTLAGYGFLLAATEVTAFVLAANIASPWLSRLLDRRLPAFELSERYYAIILECDARHEATIRALLLRSLQGRRLGLHGMRSRTLKDPTRVEVEATLYTARDEDAAVEQLVGELSLLPDIAAATWTTGLPPE
ncbi:MgtC/SapB family protein [Roseomonas sp. NAR14]|uniref:Protein MgtC n=1 Tax=Roseomonas acroporae TaxID=2937791 RepID=A0A9X1Y3J9_9PROT|nr:MgtC/SapB family protein [Roseomonas acroporae]MCK8782901.1 MgtC/SapB family protein [Roseomonas acroporae]